MSEADRWEPYRPPSPLAGAAPGMAEDSEERLWQRWIDAHDEAARGALVLRYASYAKALAGKLFARRIGSEIAFDDYEQFAMVGLLQAVDAYRLGRGATFKTFATLRIRGAILSGLRHLSERQEQLAWRRRIVRERAAALAPEQFSPGASPNLLGELLTVAAGLALGVLLEDSGMLRQESDSLPGNAYAETELRQLRLQVRPLLDRLTEREREVVRLHYMESRSFDEIATTLNLSKGRISQLHRQALARLRSMMDKAHKHDPVYL